MRSFSALFLVSVLVQVSSLVAAPATPKAATWSHSGVAAGAILTVTVTSADCLPITVSVDVDGESLPGGTITRVPGSFSIEIPSSARGGAYSIKVECSSWSETSTGTVI